MLKAAAIIAITIVSYSYGSTEKCKEELTRACPEPDIERTFHEPIPDVAFLDEYCETILEAVKCAADFNETCELGDMTSGVTLQELYDIASEICDDKSEVGKAYRENVDCVNDKASEFILARQDYELEIVHFVFYLANHVEDYESINYQNIVSCFGAQIADRHMRKFLESNCDEGAVKVLERIERAFLNQCPPPQSMLRFRTVYEQFLVERENMIKEGKTWQFL